MGSLKGYASRNLKTIILRLVWTMEAQLKRFQWGTILVTELETIRVIFWQKNMAALLPLSEKSEIADQPSVDSVVWLLVFTLTKS